MVAVKRREHRLVPVDPVDEGYLERLGEDDVAGTGVRRVYGSDIRCEKLDICLERLEFAGHDRHFVVFGRCK